MLGEPQQMSWYHASVLHHQESTVDDAIHDIVGCQKLRSAPHLMPQPPPLPS
jgi:hypothetical protein